jgi:hypothetical protein
LRDRDRIPVARATDWGFARMTGESFVGIVYRAESPGSGPVGTFNFYYYKTMGCFSRNLGHEFCTSVACEARRASRRAD